jgi:hypothetical protein
MPLTTGGHVVNQPRIAAQQRTTPVAIVDPNTAVTPRRPLLGDTEQLLFFPHLGKGKAVGR